MAMIKNVFRRKKKLAEEGDFYDGIDGSGLEGNNQGRENGEARKIDNSSVFDFAPELDKARTSARNLPLAGVDLRLPGGGKSAWPSRRNLLAGMAEEVEAVRTQEAVPKLLPSSKHDTAPVTQNVEDDDDEEEFGFEIEIRIQAESPLKVRRRTSSRERGTRRGARSASIDDLRAVRARSSERRTMRGGKDSLGTSRHESLGTSQSRHSSEDLNTLRRTVKASKEGIDTSETSIKATQATTSEVSNNLGNKTDKKNLNRSGQGCLSLSRHGNEELGSSRNNEDRLGTSRHDKDGLGTSRDVKGGLGSSRHSKDGLGSSRHIKDGLGSSRHNADGLGSSRHHESASARHSGLAPTSRSRSSDRLPPSVDHNRSSSSDGRRRRNGNGQCTPSPVEGENISNEPAANTVVASIEQMAGQSAKNAVTQEELRVEPDQKHEDVKKKDRMRSSSRDGRRRRREDRGNHGKLEGEETTAKQPVERASISSPDHEGVQSAEKVVTQGEFTADSHHSSEQDQKGRVRSSSRDGRRRRREDRGNHAKPKDQETITKQSVEQALLSSTDHVEVQSVENVVTQGEITANSGHSSEQVQSGRVRSSSRDGRRRRREDRGSHAKQDGEENIAKQQVEQALFSSKNMEVQSAGNLVDHMEVQSAEKVVTQGELTADSRHSSEKVQNGRLRSSSRDGRRRRREDRGNHAQLPVEREEIIHKELAENIAVKSIEHVELQSAEKVVTQGELTADSRHSSEQDQKGRMRSSSRDGRRPRREDKGGNTKLEREEIIAKQPPLEQTLCSSSDHVEVQSAEIGVTQGGFTADSHHRSEQDHNDRMRSSSRDGRRRRRQDRGYHAKLEGDEIIAKQPVDQAVVPCAKEVGVQSAGEVETERGSEPRRRVSNGSSSSKSRSSSSDRVKRSTSRDRRPVRISHGDQQPSEGAEDPSENAPPLRSRSRDRRSRRHLRNTVTGSNEGEATGVVESGKPNQDQARASGGVDGKEGTERVAKEPVSVDKFSYTEEHAQEYAQEQVHKVQLPVVFHRVKEDNAVEGHEAEGAKYTFEEINPALKLLSFLGGDECDNIIQEPSCDREIAVSLIPCGGYDQQKRIVEDETVRDVSDLENGEEEEVSRVKAKLASEVSRVKTKLAIETVSEAADTSVAMTIPNIAEGDEEKEQREAEISSAEVPAQMGSTEVPATAALESRRTRRAEKKAAAVNNDNVASDLLGFLGLNYDDLVGEEPASSAPTAFDLISGDQVESSVDFFKGIDDEPESSVDFFKGIMSSMGNDQSRGTDNGELEYVKHTDRLNDSFGEGRKGLPPPSVAPSAMEDTEKQNARRARRMASKSKLENGCIDESQTRGVQRSKSDEFLRLQPGVNNDNDKAKKPKSGRPKIRRTKSGESFDNMCEQSLAPPSLAPPSIAPKVMRRPSKAFLAGNIEEDMPRKFTRKEVRKASKFASLDEDDGSVIDIPVEAPSLSSAKPKSGRLGLLARATSVTNVIEMTSKRVAKKAASTRHIFK